MKTSTNDPEFKSDTLELLETILKISRAQNASIDKLVDLSEDLHHRLLVVEKMVSYLDRRTDPHNRD